jgi:hypothetical protein
MTLDRQSTTVPKTSKARIISEWKIIRHPWAIILCMEDSGL